MKDNSMVNFYKEKNVLITGHTGFKGSWMCVALAEMGAHVTGYALEPPTSPSLYDICGVSNRIHSINGDIRDLDKLMHVFQSFKPEIVIHMAAQPLVRESYELPVYTYDVNVMGTVHVLECIRHTKSVKSFINVTTDKVYKNNEWEWGYRENEELNGFDPYSNSKSCSELVTSCYKNSFFQENNGYPAITTCRAGNVIGGGDFAKDRIIPDCIRAAIDGKEIIVRNPNSTRPYQHVLEPVMAYLMIAQKQYENPRLAGNYNIGPDDGNCLTTGELVDIFCEEWNRKNKKKVSWVSKNDNGPHEANFLKLDCSKIKNTFGWKPVWDIYRTMEKIVQWTKANMEENSIELCMREQLIEYFENMF